MGLRKETFRNTELSRVVVQACKHRGMRAVPALRNYLFCHHGKYLKQFAKLSGLSVAEARKINSRERGRGGRKRSEGEHPFYATTSVGRP